MERCGDHVSGYKPAHFRLGYAPESSSPNRSSSTICFALRNSIAPLIHTFLVPTYHPQPTCFLRLVHRLLRLLSGAPHPPILHTSASQTTMTTTPPSTFNQPGLRRKEASRRPTGIMGATVSRTSSLGKRSSFACSEPEIYEDCRMLGGRHPSIGWITQEIWRVHDRAKFEEEVLPKYLAATKVSSSFLPCCFSLPEPHLLSSSRLYDNVTTMVSIEL